MKVVFGGTFDPVHIGHVRMALELIEALQGSIPKDSAPRSVDFLPCYEAVHKSGVAASPDQRKAMLDLSILGSEQLALDERELRRRTPSFTVDTLRELRAELGAEPLVFAMGSDSASSMRYWRDIAEYAGLCHVVVMRRSQVEAGFCGDFFGSVGYELASSLTDLAKRPAGRVIELELKLLDISSSDIRERVASGRSIRYLVSGAVEQYICDNALYTKTLGG